MLIVKKFGGTSVANKERIYNVARRCIRDYEKGNDVVVVLSAMGKYTDELIEKARDINPNPPKREMDMLLTIGEQMSVSLMAMGMAEMGVRAISLNAFQVGMHTTSAHGNARLKKIDTERIRRELDDRKIVIITGFQGVNKYDDYTTLGRGGSDTTAVALAAVLHADACEIYTDVDGVYTADPRLVPTAKKLKAITYDEMLDLAALGAGLLLYLYLLYLVKGRLSKIASNISGGALVTLACIMLYQWGIGHHLGEMIIGSIIPLVPGVAFTTAIRDIADEDYIAGAVRMLDALLVTFCIAMGVGVVMIAYHHFVGGLVL